MDLEMVLNELSLRTPAADIPTARQLMSELITTIRTATAQGVKKVIRRSIGHNLETHISLLHAVISSSLLPITAFPFS